MLKRFSTWLTGLLLRNGKINRPIALALYLTAVLPVLLVAAMSYLKTDKDLTEFTLSRRQTLAYVAAMTVRADLDRLIDVGVSLATRPVFCQRVVQRRWSEAIDLMKRVPEDFPSIERIFVNDPEGTLMADVPSLPAVKGKNFSFRDWYKGVSRDWQPYVSEVYKRSADPPYNVFALAIPVRSEKGDVAGILVLQIRPKILLEWTKNIDVGASGRLFCVDQRGHVAAHPDYAPENEIIDRSEMEFVGKVMRGERGVESLLPQGAGEKQVAAYEPVPGYGWGVIVEQPVSTAFAARDQSLRLILLAYGGILFFSAACSYLMLRVLIDRKRAEDEIRHLNQDLERRAVELDTANKELEAFSYSVSHDLRAPLRHIGGFSDLLGRHLASGLDETGRRYMDTISSSVKRMGDLIDDLLALSRVGRAEMGSTRVPLGTLVAEVVRELEEEARGRRIDWKIAALPEVRGDRALLRQALVNLISNALKYTRNRPQACIEIGAAAPNGETVVCVRDNGVGFDMHYAHKLFGVFQRLHNAEEFEGTGIGLASVRRIIQRHGGRTWAEGLPGQGAAFYFSLPNHPGGA